MWKKIAIGVLVFNFSLILFVFLVARQVSTEVRIVFSPNISEVEARGMIKEYCDAVPIYSKESESGWKLFESVVRWNKLISCTNELKENPEISLVSAMIVF